MLIQQGYRYELKPNNKQRTLLAKHAGTARFTYNWGLARRIEEYKRTGKSSNAIEQHRHLNVLKKSNFPWMYEVSKCAPQEALRDLQQAYQNFFRDIKNGKKTGFPKFKKKGVNDSFRLTGSIHVFDKSVQLPRIGVVRTKEKADVKGRILSVTVSREADHWYVSLAVERKGHTAKYQWCRRRNRFGSGIVCHALQRSESIQSAIFKTFFAAAPAQIEAVFT